jgi:hypothetical protein
VSLNGIQDDVAGEDEPMRFLLDQDALEPFLEEMTAPLVPLVEDLHVSTEETMHAGR